MTRALSLILLLLCLFPAPGARAETSGLREYEDIPIIEVRFVGNQDVDDDELCAALLVGEGDPFSADQVEQSRQALLAMDKFTAAEVEVERDDQGLVIVFTMKEKWHVMSIPLIGRKSPRSSAACKAKLASATLSDLEGLPIEAIRFEDNKTTKDRILRQEILFTEGDPFSVKQLIGSRQSIKNLGLFKRVWARAERGDDGVIVTFTVREKWYILPIPTISRNSDGDVSYGGELTWDNLWGLNHSLQFEAEQQDQVDGETEQSVSLDYEIPKIAGSLFNVSAGAKRQRTLRDASDLDPPDPDEEDPLPWPQEGTYYEYLDRLDMGVSRWIKRVSPSQGWIGGGRLIWSRTYYDVVSGDPVLEDDQRRLNFNVNGGYTAVNDFEYYRDGQTFGASLDFGRQGLGSTDNYTTVNVFWRRYQPLQVPVRANLNMQMQAGFNHGENDIFELGGADTMRGILDDSTLEGDSYYLLNLNWLIPIPRYPAFRWNIFTDIGNAWEREDFRPLDLKYTVGVGARWRIRALVNTSLRLDIGVNPTTGEYKVYAGTSQMF